MPKPLTVLALMIFVLAAGYVASFLSMDWYYYWGNTVFHFIGGCLAATLVLSYYFSEFNKLSQPFRFFALLGCALIIGVFWEFHEYILSTLHASWPSFAALFPKKLTFIGDLDDTIKDLLMDSLGGVTVALYYFVFKRKSE